MELLVASFTSFLVQLPVVLVWLVGLILALIFWKRHPRVSLLTVIAILGLLILSFLGTYLNIALPVTLHSRNNLSFSQLTMTLAVVNIIISVFSAILWGLLVAAIFGWRKSAAA